MTYIGAQKLRSSPQRAKLNRETSLKSFASIQAPVSLHGRPSTVSELYSAQKRILLRSLLVLRLTLCGLRKRT